MRFFLFLWRISLPIPVTAVLHDRDSTCGSIFRHSKSIKLSDFMLPFFIVIRELKCVFWAEHLENPLNLWHKTSELFFVIPGVWYRWKIVWYGVFSKFSCVFQREKFVLESSQYRVQHNKLPSWICDWSVTNFTVWFQCDCTKTMSAVSRGVGGYTETFFCNRGRDSCRWLSKFCVLFTLKKKNNYGLSCVPKRTKIWLKSAILRLKKWSETRPSRPRFSLNVAIFSP